MGTPRYRYSNLSAALRHGDSPLSQYLSHRFGDVAPIQKEYRQGCGPLLVEPTGANPATVGTAFDLAVRFILAPNHVPETAMYGFGKDVEALQMVSDLSSYAGEATIAPDGDWDELVRACWALALCVNIYRRGPSPDSALVRLAERGRITIHDALALAPRGGLLEIGKMLDLAQTSLLPFLAEPVFVGPEFDLSVWCAADADLIAAGSLIDLKTHVGRKVASGRASSLSRVELFQVIAYALFDSSDKYRVTGVGIYAARFACLARWPLLELLRTLSGDGELTIDGERTRMRRTVVDGVTPG